MKFSTSTKDGGGSSIPLGDNAGSVNGQFERTVLNQTTKPRVMAAFLLCMVFAVTYKPMAGSIEGIGSRGINGFRNSADSIQRKSRIDTEAEEKSFAVIESRVKELENKLEASSNIRHIDSVDKASHEQKVKELEDKISGLQSQIESQVEKLGSTKSDESSILKDRLKDLKEQLKSHANETDIVGRQWQERHSAVEASVYDLEAKLKAFENGPAAVATLEQIIDTKVEDTTVATLEQPIDTKVEDSKGAAAVAELEKIVGRFEEAKNQMNRMLEDDYGKDYYDQVFNESRTARKGALSSVRSTNLGRLRLKRKIQMKILKYLIATTTATTRMSSNRIRRALSETELPASSNSTTSTIDDDAVSSIPFVWATGGHSSAAAHGDLYNESYTAYLERAASNVFATTGLDFEGRAFAIGGMTSSPEVALCSEAVFGTDIDVLSWDYGMIDGGQQHWKRPFYFSRAGLNPGRPVAVAIGIADSIRGELGELEAQGLPTLFLRPSIVTDAINKVPDTSTMNHSEMAALDPYIKHFKCGNGIEKGEPFCAENKYSKNICPKRKYQFGWHPGWKWHALHGNLMAVSLVEVLEEALTDIRANVTDFEQSLKELKAEEDKDFETFAKANLTGGGRAVPFKSVDTNQLFKKPNICRTSYLPSQTRYLGIADGVRTDANHKYEMGTFYDEALKKPNNETNMRLVWSNEDRQQCEVELNVDNKDIWLVQHGDRDWQKITIPNKLEIEEYGRKDDENKPIPFEGIVAACVKRCYWGKCGPQEVRHSDIFSAESPKAQIKINGENVTSGESWEDCMFFFNEEGQTWKPNENGQYDIEVQVTTPGRFIQFSHFVIF